MLNYQIRIPMTYVENARAICEVLRNALVTWSRLKDETTKPDQLRDGLAAVDRYNQAMEAIDQDILTAIEESRATLDEVEAQYNANLDNQVTPHGEDLDNPDFTLIREGLVMDAGQLSRIANSHEGNYTMLTAIDAYAQRRGWGEFVLVSNIGSARDFGANWFAMARSACAGPDSLAMMQITHPGEMARMMDAYGLGYAVPEGERQAAAEEPEEPEHQDDEE